MILVAYLSLLEAHELWQIVEEGCECWRETYSYLLADRTKDQQSCDRFWWCAKDFYFYDFKIGSHIPRENSHNTFLAWNAH